MRRFLTLCGLAAALALAVPTAKAGFVPVLTSPAPGGTANAFLYNLNFTSNGSTETLYWKDLLSGALIKSVVERSKDFAIKRSIEKESEHEGVSLDDLQRAVRVEYKENEIFPKGDSQEDWLKLLDYDPENVATIKPIRAKKQLNASRRNII